MALLKFREAMSRAVEDAVQATANELPDVDENLIRECAHKTVHTQYERHAITLFDYKKRPHIFLLPSDSPIDLIDIEVWSGDECATVYQEDGSISYFDADVNNEREVSFDDGSYTVTAERLAVWEERDGSYGFSFLNT